jgi:hypothetical protein
MTRAGFLWKNGEGYCCDFSQPPPLMWVNNCPQVPPGGPDGAPGSAAQSGGQAEAIRGIQKEADGYLVSIQVKAGSTAAWAIEETVPSGCNVSEITEGGTLDPAGQRIRWGPFFDGADRQLVYRLISPAASAAVAVSGVLSADGLDSAVISSAVIIAAADFDLDGDVDPDDLSVLRSCITGPSMRLTGPGCDRADFDADGDVDQADFGAFQRCISGRNQIADAACLR